MTSKRVSINGFNKISNEKQTNNVIARRIKQEAKLNREKAVCGGPAWRFKFILITRILDPRAVVRPTEYPQAVN